MHLEPVLHIIAEGEVWVPRHVVQLALCDDEALDTLADAFLVGSLTDWVPEVGFFGTLQAGKMGLKAS